jgi:cation diffusion facilitator CzcD-associated flavoprotein CzcO
MARSLKGNAREIDTDLLIIGAGPFGLAMAAYAKHLGLDHRLVGTPMESWKVNMPKGMYLRSASDWHLDPVGQDTIESFLKAQGLTAAQVEPLSLEFYLRYARWFQERKEIEALAVYIRRLDYLAKAARFQATTEDDQIINANRVVVAVGFKYFKHLPAEVIQHVPPGRVSHTCDLVSFAELDGKRCLILGGRQSAFEWTALIHEAGAAAVHVCHRHASPAFRAADWSWVTPLVDLIAKDPGWFRKLSTAEREEVNYRLWAEGRLKVEPWLESRVLQDTITLWPGSQIVACAKEPGGDLAVRLDNGGALVVDHVIAATGYKVDIPRVPFLAAGNVLERLEIRGGFPMLDEHFQTNIPGLFITGMAAVQDFGPFWAFTIAARASAQIIGRALRLSCRADSDRNLQEIAA